MRIILLGVVEPEVGVAAVSVPPVVVVPVTGPAFAFAFAFGLIVSVLTGAGDLDTRRGAEYMQVFRGRVGEVEPIAGSRLCLVHNKVRLLFSV